MHFTKAEVLPNFVQYFSAENIIIIVDLSKII